MFNPFYVKNEDGTGEWKAASNLKACDELLSEDGKKVKVSEVKVEKLAEEITVYNLDLDEVHTYYVAGGVLVHNECEKKIVDEFKNADIIYKENPITGISEPYMKKIEIDGHKLLLRRDVGGFSHGYNDHWNLELQTSAGNTKYDLHMYIDEIGNIIKWRIDKTKCIIIFY